MWLIYTLKPNLPMYVITSYSIHYTKLYEILIILGLVIALPALSQKPLSLQESRNLALEFNKSLKMSSMQKVAAEAKRKEVFTNYLPKLEASGNMMHFPSMEDNVIPAMVFPSAANPTGELSDAVFPGMVLETEKLVVLTGALNIVQPIYMGGKIRTANKMAQTGEQIAEQAVITSYSIHYTKLYDFSILLRH